MKLIITPENFKSGLLTAGRVISQSHTLPSLNNFYLETKNGLLFASATNLEIGVRVQIRCKVEIEGKVCIPAKTTLDLLQALPEGNLEIEVSDNQLILKAEGFKTQLNTFPVDDFPEIPFVQSTKKINLEAKKLQEGLEQVIFASSLNETQPEIAGVLFSFTEKDLTLAATDRYRLAEYKINLESPVEEKIIIPQRSVIEFIKLASTAKDNLELILSHTQIQINYEGVEVVSRLIDGQFPDYKVIIPDNFETTLTVEKRAVSQAVKAASVFSKSNQSISLEVLENKIKIAGQSADFGQTEIDITAEVTGKPLKILLNYKYLQEMLNANPSEKLWIGCNSSDSAAVFHGETQKNYNYLIMPINA